MIDFKEFKHAVQHQFNTLKKQELFRVEIEKDDLWETYLGSFPEGSNPMYRERTEHDCSCCRAFVKNIGSLVGIVDNKLVSLWDVRLAEPYQTVANALSAKVKEQFIANRYLHTEPVLGTDKNFEEKEGGGVTTYHHFHLTLPKELVVKGDDIGPRLSQDRASRDVFYRSLTELKESAMVTVLELISQNSLYRGEEHKFAVTEFLKHKRAFDKLTIEEQDNFCWSRLSLPASVLRIRNTSIGTLLTNISEDMDLERAVAAFEAMVAPANYKRPTAVVTKAMVESARKKISELGYEHSLERRYATLEDISVNNILFVDRNVQKNLQGSSVFDEILGGIGEKTKSLDRVEEISIDKFLADVLPTAKSLEVMFENRHASNLVSLIAPADMTAKHMFKWPNPFSWAYSGDLADSIKERVKRAGGRVDADLRCSLSWFNYDDLDLHLIEPNGNHIYFGNKVSVSTHGALDVDMNAGSVVKDPVENIFFASRQHMAEGEYHLFVNQFRRRESQDVGFEAEIEFDGTTTRFAYPNVVARDVTIAKFKFSRKDGITWLKTLEHSTANAKVVEHWGINTQTFHRVNLAMLSPNHWDGLPVGNRHFFFFLDKCTNDGTPRGFFNEFLSQELDPHRKVLEVVGARMTAEQSDRQLSGLGFSSTKRESLIVRVGGTFTRTVKVMF